jgi:hypothetical protein
MQTQDLTVATREPMPVANVAPTPAMMLQGVLERGVTPESVAVVEKLVDLYERMDSKEAERAFAAAFVALQSEMPSVKAMSVIPDKQGNVRSRFASYEEIMSQVAPLLKKHGFTVTFSTDYKENRIVKTCTLQHTGGHSRSNTFAARIGSGPPGSSEAQGDGAASTYAKRFALCDALNIVIDVDTDARAEGSAISKDQAESLRQRVKDTNSNEAKFLAFAGAASFEEIMSSKYAQLDSFLSQKERTTK